MKFHASAKHIIIILIGAVTVLSPASARADGYSIVDRDGNIISDDSKKIVTVGPSEKKVIFCDKADRKVFDVEWDASHKRLIVTGENIYLRIYSTGKVEKFMDINENNNEKNQAPLTIQPVVPIFPGQKPPQQK